jgi:DNA-binding transcriptional MerR regulator
MDGTEPLYSIGAVAVRLGLSPARLRQLEHERVLPLPRRLASGLRLYTEGDIALLRERLDARRAMRRPLLVT